MAADVVTPVFNIGRYFVVAFAFRISFSSLLLLSNAGLCALRPFSYFSYSLDIPVERGLLSGTRLLFWVMVESVGNPLTRIQVKQLSSKFREETETFLTVPPRLPPMGQ